jgi:hypothetical protein
MTLEDQLLDIDAKVTALTAAVAVIPTTQTSPTVDLSPVLTALATLQTDVSAIQAQLQPTPGTAPSTPAA